MGLVLLAAPAIGAPATSAREQSLLARVTVYWASGGGGSDRWTRKHQTATNVRLRAGHCAVDPKRIPYGSKVLFPDAALTAVDTGKHVVSRKAARKSGRTAPERNALVIDRFFETKKQALGWARTHPHFMTLRILPPNHRPESPPTSRVASHVYSSSQKLVAYQSAQPGVSRAPVSRYANMP
jgi:3D (Asp-Asp-Asp) domain-containing protein